MNVVLFTCVCITSGAVLLGGCSTVQSRISDNRSYFEAQSQSKQNRLVHYYPMIGDNEVDLAIGLGAYSSKQKVRDYVVYSFAGYDTGEVIEHSPWHDNRGLVRANSYTDLIVYVRNGKVVQVSKKQWSVEPINDRLTGIAY